MVISENSDNRMVTQTLMGLKRDLRSKLEEGARGIDPKSKFGDLLNRRADLYFVKDELGKVGSIGPRGTLNTSAQALKQLLTGTAKGSSAGSVFDEIARITGGEVDLRGGATFGGAIMKGTSDPKITSLLTNTMPGAKGLTERGMDLVKNIFVNPESTLLKFAKRSPKEQAEIIKNMKNKEIVQ